METIGNLKVAKNEADRTYRIEQLPGLVAIENLDYPEKKDRDDVEIINTTSVSSKQEAVARISFIRAQTAAFGANDFELSEMGNLIERVNNGTISPAEALKTAQEIFASKNDRH